MKKEEASIGIVTLGNSTNYGGVLQATALSMVLIKLGYTPTLITFQQMESAWRSPSMYVKTRIRLYGSKGIYTKLRICGGIIKTIISNYHYFDRKTKIENFRNFINDNLRVTDYYASVEEARLKCPCFDAYLVGSDQVWNFDFNFGEFDYRYLLSFAPTMSKKYAYAASTGGRKEDCYIYKLLMETREFNGITVREESLASQMKKLGTDVEVALDPTILLDKKDWIGMERKPNLNLPLKYILTYYLEKTSKTDPIISKIAQKTGLTVVDIGADYGKTEYNRILADTVGPAEFLYLVHHASYVITNSFHMTVFSIIFEKNFLTLPRNGQESRVEDLLKKLDMKEHLLNQEEDWLQIMNGYKTPFHLLDSQRMSSLSFLKNIGENPE